jgi:signal transduction histidine kinase
MREDWRFKTAAYAGWLAIAVPTIVDIRAGHLTGLRALAWATAFLVFGATYAAYLRPASPDRRRSAAIPSIATLAVAGLTMVLTSVGLMKYLASITLTIVAGELPYLFSPRIVWMWVAAQSVVLGAVFWISFGWVSGLAGGSAYAGFQVFALGRAWVELRERAAREELARANAELRATRALLAESSRVAERLRISRDLHDSLGHHLTALSLQLDVAARKIDGPVADHVQAAHAITRLLLTDLRSVVGQLRDRGHIDLSGAIRSLEAMDGLPRVHVDVPDTLCVESPGQANALLRCAQEIVTNAVRHARAQNVWIRLAPGPGGIELDARDDGIGAARLRPGHGLNGMRERFEEHGGNVEFSAAAGRGFAVRAFMPRLEPGS